MSNQNGYTFLFAMLGAAAGCALFFVIREMLFAARKRAWLKRQPKGGDGPFRTMEREMRNFGITPRNDSDVDASLLALHHLVPPRSAPAGTHRPRPTPTTIPSSGVNVKR